MARSASRSAVKSVASGKRVSAIDFAGAAPAFRGVERVPDLFGEEGHEGAEEAQSGFVDLDECVRG